MKRRNFLLLLGTATGGAALGIPAPSLAGMLSTQAEVKSASPFSITPLPYAYNALEPYIDAATMRFHHDNHYATYIKNLNEAVNKYPQLQTKSAEALLRQLNSLPEDIMTTVRNNGGGYVNHKMYWEIMGPNGGGAPSGAIANAIDRTFGSFDTFKEQFNQAGVKRFGSGWAWLVRNQQGNLQVMSTANQDSPLLAGMYPIMGNDVWEHAYYLKYQYRRAKYLSAWWNVINWNEVNKRFLQASA